MPLYWQIVFIFDLQLNRQMIRINTTMALRIIHTADWHLGQLFFGYDRDAEQEVFLRWLVATLAERQTDVLLIAGDVFDVANPSAAAQRRFFRFLSEASRQNPGLQILVIAGNHDSAVRLEAPNPLFEEFRTRVIGNVRRKEDGTIDFDALLCPLCDRAGRRRAWCLAVPFLRQGDYPAPEEMPDTYVAGVGRLYRQLYAYAEQRRQPGEALLAMGHLHASGAELSAEDRSERVIMGGLESVSADTFHPGLAYTALGHIHKAQRVGGRETVRYAGSPLPMSFSETHYRHQVVEVALNGGASAEICPLDIPLAVPLWRIPGEAAAPDEVLVRLAALPEAEGEERDFWPFLEVRVLLTEPDPGFRHRVEEVLEKKAVRLTAIVPVYPERKGTDEIAALSYGDLQRIDPLDMLQHAFMQKYGGALPDEIGELFNEVLREVTV